MYLYTMYYTKIGSLLLGLFLLFGGCKKKNEAVEECVCYLLYAPVCAGGKAYDNDCMARCDGYTDEEMTPIDWVDGQTENLQCNSTD